MAKPAQSALSEQDLHTAKVSESKNLGVGHSFFPRNAQDTANASQVEDVVSSILSGICGSRLAAVQQLADDAYVVCCHLYLHRQLGVCPHVGRETSKCCSCLPNPLVKHCNSKERLSEPSA